MSMTEYTESDALPAGPVVERTVGGEGELSTRQAARALAQTRYKEQAGEVREAEPPSKTNENFRQAAVEAQEAPAQESAGEADTGEAEAPPPGESEVTEAEAALPPLEAPRSWTKEDKELFQSLPRETQERVAERERSRERDFSRRQQEATEKLKGLTAQQEAVEQARQRYEAQLPALLQTLQDAQSGEFADIRSLQDVTALAQSDPFRFSQWQAHQMKVAAVSEEIRKATEAREQEKAKKHADFVKAQDALFFEKVPEMADTKKASELARSAIEMLKDKGFSEDELGKLYHGNSDISLRDHRLQLLIVDAVKYREAQAAAKKVTAAPKPPVQRPGAAPQKGDSIDAQIKALTTQINNSKGLEQVRLATQLTLLRRSAAAR